MANASTRLLVVAAVVVVLAVAVGWLFIADVGAADPGPVAFDDTVRVGMTDEARLDLGDEVSLPKVQVAYSGYRYVVGYHGVERAAVDLTDSNIEYQLGQPLAIYTTDYSVAGVSLDDDGYPVTVNPVQWRPAASMHYVVDSEARGPYGPVAIPFATMGEAEAFTEAYGGDIVDWQVVLERADAVEPVRPDLDRVESLHERADGLSHRADEQLDRPVSVVVGSDADTIQSAIDAAEDHTTVLVPSGTYHEEITVDRPVTVLGQDAVIEGYGNGTVVELTADGAAIAGVEIRGVGDQLRAPERVDDDPDEWDHNIELGYGHGDAGVAAIEAADTAVVDVMIETPANGVLLRDAPDAVVRGVTVDGSDDWLDGFMGVMAMRSPGVIEESTLVGGRDGVYLHRSPELVIRDNQLAEGRYGIHLMHTSGALMDGNTIRDQSLGGIMLMTDPEANAIVGNDIRRSGLGITTVGSANLIADNVVVDNLYGLRMSDHDSRYEGNVVLGNDVGARVAGFLPTNVVVANDFVENDRQLEIGFGPLEVWSARGVGNYWGVDPSAGMSTAIDRLYAPADPIDARLDRVDGVRTLANSPGLAAVDALRDATPGLRQGVVDRSPLTEPANPERLEQAIQSDPEVVDA